MKKIYSLIFCVLPFSLMAQNNVYIGPYTPATAGEGRLSISGALGEVSLLNRTATSFIQDPTIGERWSIYNDGKLKFWSGADKMTLTHDGRLGIGITSPLDKLHVYGDISIKPDDTSTPSYINFKRADGWIAARIGQVYSQMGYGGHLVFATNKSTGATELVERMRITYLGKIGIGTTTPDHLLEIAEISGTPSLGIKGDLDSKLVFEPSDGSDRFTIWSDMDYNTYNDLLRFGAVNAPDILTLKGDGNVGIGTITPDAKLTVKGDIHTREVRVDMTGPLQGPDYVFEKDYDLLPLAELEAYINQNKHLPEVPSAKEMEANGLNLKEMNLLLLKKVEELTLHVIELEKRDKTQQKEIEQLKNRIK